MIDIISIPQNVEAYLIKTCNGKYYDDFLETGRIDHYKYPLAKSTESHVKEHELLYEMKPQDLIVMSGYRHQRVMIGVLESCAPDLRVHWLQEVKTSRMPQLYPYLYRKSIVCAISGILTNLFRHVYPCFAYDERYHLVLQVEQPRPVSLKSLLGFEKLVFDAAGGKPLSIKIQLESPGLIELISEYREVIVAILKLVCLLFELKEKRKIKQEYEALYNVYHQYGLDELKLNVKNTAKMTKHRDKG